MAVEEKKINQLFHGDLLFLAVFSAFTVSILLFVLENILTIVSGGTHILLFGAAVTVLVFYIWSAIEVVLYLKRDKQKIYTEDLENQEKIRQHKNRIRG